jgi:hypothetical protein
MSTEKKEVPYIQKTREEGIKRRAEKRKIRYAEQKKKAEAEAGCAA